MTYASGTLRSSLLPEGKIAPSAAPSGGIAKQRLLGKPIKVLVSLSKPDHGIGSACPADKLSFQTDGHMAAL